MRKMLPNRLVKHLSENNMSYLAHMKRALWISMMCAKAALFCLVHAIIPFMFEDTASRIIKKIEKEL